MTEKLFFIYYTVTLIHTFLFRAGAFLRGLYSMGIYWVDKMQWFYVKSVEILKILHDHIESSIETQIPVTAGIWICVNY